MSVGAEDRLDPALLAQLEGLTLERALPLIAVDADEVLVFLSDHLARWLPDVGYRMHLTRYQLEGSIFPGDSDVPVPFDECLMLLDRFFESEVLHQLALPGAVEALERLAEVAQIVVLTNVPAHGGEMRRQNLKALGIPYPVVVNGGGKGRALAWLAGRAGPTIFIDDSLKQHESAARRAPDVTRIHFVGAPHLQRLLPESPGTDHRAADWEECESVIRGILEL